VSFDSQALHGMTLAAKQRVLVQELRKHGDCAWPVDDGIELIPLGGGRLPLSIDAAIKRIVDFESRARMPMPQYEDGGALITTDASGQRCVRVNDPVSNFAFPPAPSGRRRI
jgi:hypothetical protein